MLKKFNAIVILFFILKNYSEGAPKKRKGETSGQQTQGNANYFEGGSSSSPALTLVPPTNFYCQWDGCEQVFDNDETFVEHVKAHANMEKDKKCHWRDCEREEPFQRPAHLKRHIVGHTGEKPYVCEHVNQDGVRCDKSYTREHNLTIHKQTHAGERIIYKCAYPPCTKVGQTLQGVQEHFVHPTYQHGGELQLFPTNVEHQEDHQNEEYYQGNYPYEDEDVNTDLGL
uniref:C2H2-type domain-containing protein n=1 Tax=Meloidogyne incognita TaxID=6306 RepID=A0A914NL09_MELIC